MILHTTVSSSDVFPTRAVCHAPQYKVVTDPKLILSRIGGYNVKSTSGQSRFFPRSPVAGGNHDSAKSKSGNRV
jgi:hypothetical protein